MDMDREVTGFSVLADFVSPLLQQSDRGDNERDGWIASFYARWGGVDDHCCDGLDSLVFGC